MFWVSLAHQQELQLYVTLKCAHFLGLICYSLYTCYTVLSGRQALSTQLHIQADRNFHFTVTTTTTLTQQCIQDWKSKQTKIHTNKQIYK
jgi:exosortase/archaeosortase